MLTGSLPWIYCKDNPEFAKEALRLKQETSVQALCYGLPVECLVYMRYVKDLGIKEEMERKGIKSSTKGKL